MGSSEWYGNKYFENQRNGHLAIINLLLLRIYSQTIERVISHKLLGVHIHSSLSWSIHTDERSDQYS